MKNNKETFEDIIIKVISQIGKQKREQEKLMIEGCKTMVEKSLKITKEFENSDSDIDWE